MKSEILAGTQCDVCGSWEFECRDEQLFCVTCQLPAQGMEIEALRAAFPDDQENATRH